MIKQRTEIVNGLSYPVLSGSTLCTIICPDLRFYIRNAKLIELTERKNHPIKSFINNFLYSQGNIDYFIKELILRRLHEKELPEFFSLKKRIFYRFEQERESLIGFFYLSELINPNRDELVEFSLKAKEGDLVNVRLSPLRKNRGIEYAEIYWMAEAKKKGKLNI
jgi:hypothetical protein